MYPGTTCPCMFMLLLLVFAPASASIACKARSTAEVHKLSSMTADAHSDSEAVPDPDSMQVDVAWAARHVRSLLALSARIEAGGHAARKQILSTGPTTVRLSTCGTVMVPFGGLLLLEFEAHLRAFNVSDAGALSGAPSRRGMEHVVMDYNPSGSSAWSDLGFAGVSHVLRTDSRTYSHRLRRCFGYRITVWNMYVQWILGELSIMPRVHVAWFSWKALTMNVIVEKYQSLRDVLRAQLNTSTVAQPVPSGPTSEPLLTGDTVRLDDTLVDSLIDLFRQLARASSLLNVDFKPQDFLVRSDAGGHWEIRLADIAARGAYQPVAGLVPGLTSPCQFLLNLMLPVRELACGPLRRSRWARRFVE